MNFRDHFGINIVLSLQDRRGNRVRAAVCERLKIKVWTQDPRHYLTFTLRDIQQDHHEDILPIPDYQMEALQPGVVVYSYIYEVMPRVEYQRTIVTDIRWHGGHHDGNHDGHHPGNTVNWQTLEHIKDQIEDVERHLSKRIVDLNKYVRNECGGKIDEESQRAQEAEKLLCESIGNLLEALGSETERATEAEGTLSSSIESLQTEFSEFLESYGQDHDETEKRLKHLLELLDRLKKHMDGKLSAVNTRIEEEIAKKIAVDAEQSALISAETSRAKSEEARLQSNFMDLLNRLKKHMEGKLSAVNTRIEEEISKKVAVDAEQNALINAETSRAKSEEARLQSNLLDLVRSTSRTAKFLEKEIDRANRKTDEETSRAKLVEKDLAESLQRLKQSVADGSLGMAADLEALRAELIEKIDYRIKEIVGAAPEALDTLEEIAAKLMEDDDIFKAIREILMGKANVDNVYTRGAIDELLLDISNTIKAEVQRAELAEQKNASAIEILNGDDTTPGSVAHALTDANHYTDDAIRAHQREVDGDLKDIEDRLDTKLADKQEKGDYVTYTSGEGRKHVILPNHCNIVGTTQDGTDGRNLIMLSKWNVVDIGSANTPVNLNGLNDRPTYNDTKQIALLEDIKVMEIDTVPLETIRAWFPEI